MGHQPRIAGERFLAFKMQKTIFKDNVSILRLPRPVGGKRDVHRVAHQLFFIISFERPRIRKIG